MFQRCSVLNPNYNLVGILAGPHETGKRQWVALALFPIPSLSEMTDRYTTW